MSVTLSVGLVTALAGSISIDIARFFAGSIYVMVNFYEFVCDKVNSLPHHLIEFGGISIFTLLLIYMLYIVIYNIIIKEINVKSICIPTALIFVVVANFYLNRNIVTYIDTNYAKNMVTIDGNFCRMVNFGSRSSAGLGKQRILRYLKYKHINRINELYILKGNYYFVGGYLECAADINVDKIYVLESCKQDSMYNRLLRAAEDNGAEIVYVDENDIPKEYFELLNYEDT